MHFFVEWIRALLPEACCGPVGLLGFLLPSQNSATTTCPPQMAYQVVKKSAALDTLQSQLEERQDR